MQRSQRTHSRADAAAVKRPKSKPQLKIRAGTDGRSAGSARTADAVVSTRSQTGGQAGNKSVKKLRLAEGTTPEASGVAAIEIRPSGTVVSRRPAAAARRTPVLHVPVQSATPAAPPAWMLQECRVAPARAGDQNEILQLLAGLPTPPSRAEFHAAVDHPDHHAGNRLVARLAGRIVGHVEIIPRDIMLGAVVPGAPEGVAVRGAVIDRVAVLPECRGAGHGQRLVRAAEDRMRQLDAVVAFSRTRIAPSFRELGWSVLARDCATPGRPAEILARLLEGPQRGGDVVTMRQWRHVELPAILRIYRQNAARFVGPLNRDENYSRWLVSRGAFDSILVALVGQDRYDLHETTARIVGYCVQAGHRVLEIMADPEFPGLEREILARVCGEAIENDRQEIVYESHAADPLHAAVTGGDSLVQSGDRMIVAKVLRPADLLAALVPAFAGRAATAGIRETVELGLDAPGFRGSVVVADGKATMHAGRVGRSYLTLADDELGRLLLGQCDPVEAAASGRLTASTQIAIKLASQIFPRTPLWCPMWDDLPA